MSDQFINQCLAAYRDDPKCSSKDNQDHNKGRQDNHINNFYHYHTPPPNFSTAESIRAKISSTDSDTCTELSPSTPYCIHDPVESRRWPTIMMDLTDIKNGYFAAVFTLMKLAIGFSFFGSGYKGYTLERYISGS